MSIIEYVDQKKEIQKNINKVIDDEADEDYTELFNFIDSQNYLENKDEFKELIYFLTKLLKNYHRTTTFIHKMKQILLHIIEDIKQVFSNLEIFDLFKENKLILLFLIQNKIVTIDEQISKIITQFHFICYFYPEIKPFLDEKLTKKIEKKLTEKDPNYLEHFEEKRQEGENDSTICQIIRNDSIDEFIVFLNEPNSTHLNSIIENSIFETNSFLLVESPTLIEYAAFCGSIRIFNYLILNGAKIDKKLWLYAIHGRNTEIIAKLDEEIFTNLSENDYKSYFKEAVKCHHNEIAHYIKDKLIIEDENEEIEDDNQTNLDFYGNVLNCSFQYHNYEFFPKIFNDKYILYLLVKYHYSNLVKLLFKVKGDKLQNILNLKFTVFNVFNL